MQVKCKIDGTHSVKAGLKIVLYLDKQQKAEFLKNQINFEDMPLVVDFAVDTGERQKQLNQISEGQRDKIYAIFKDISSHTGEDTENVKRVMKAQYRKAYHRQDFSLSNVDKEIASEFIEYLIVFCLQQGIETTDSAQNLFGDSEKYLYTCVKLGKCCVCGAEGTVINNGSQESICLCEKHEAEARTNWKTFSQKYVVGMVKCNQ